MYQNFINPNTFSRLIMIISDKKRAFLFGECSILYLIFTVVILFPLWSCVLASIFLPAPQRHHANGNEHREVHSK